MIPKVFISYCTANKELAQRLKDDLRRQGCDSWQFDLSAIPGTDAWGAILERIEKSDYFVVLLSDSAISSRPVLEEISHAHYCSLNNPESHPRIVPLLLEDGLAVPRQIIRAVHLKFREHHYNNDFDKLLRALGIDESPFASVRDLEVTFSQGREFEVEREAGVYVSSLIRNHPDVAQTFEALSAPAQLAAGGRWQMPSARTIIWRAETYREARQPQYWRKHEYKILVILPLHRGYSSGYEYFERIVVEIAAFQDLKYDYTDNPTGIILYSDTLRLKFEGFREVKSLPM